MRFTFGLNLVLSSYRSIFRYFDGTGSMIFFTKPA